MTAPSQSDECGQSGSIEVSGELQPPEVVEVKADLESDPSRHTPWDGPKFHATARAIMAFALIAILASEIAGMFVINALSSPGARSAMNDEFPGIFATTATLAGTAVAFYFANRSEGDR